MPSYSIALNMKLKPGMLEAYCKAHANLWPGVAESMARNSVSMAIYLRGDSDLFLFASAPSQDHWDRSRDDPELDRWNDAMTAFLETDVHGNILLVPLLQVFGFGEFFNGFN